MKKHKELQVNEGRFFNSVDYPFTGVSTDEPIQCKCDDERLY